MTKLRAYLERLESILRTRQELSINYLLVRLIEQFGNFRAEVRFYDSSVLIIREELALRVEELPEVKRLRYAFHYQTADGTLIFRYDNAPHFPELSTFPAHKHTPDGVVESKAPDLSDVLREIDSLLYSG